MQKPSAAKEARDAAHQAAIAEIMEKAVVEGVVAGRALGLGRGASYRALRKGEIPSVMIGGVYRCPTLPLRRMLRLEAASAA